MDSFSRLPPTIRTDIIVHLESYSSIMKLIRASATMLWQYKVDRHVIATDILRLILDSDKKGAIFQDALAIVHSREFDNSLRPSERRRCLMRRDRPDPIAQGDKQTTLKLFRVISLMICWIEDYLAKATDSCPSHVYRALPEIATGWTGTRYRGELVDIKPVFFSYLRPSERCRLLQAFLRLEVICKLFVHQQHPEQLNPGSDWVLIGCVSHEPLLALVGGDETDWVALSCAIAYFRLLYKSLFMLEAHTPGSQRIRKAQKEPGPSNSILLGGPSSGYTESFDVQHPEVKLDFPDDFCVYHGLHHTRLTQYLIPYTSPHFGFDDLSLTLISTNVIGESHVPSHSNQLNRGEALRCDLLLIGYVERFRWPTSDHTRRMVTIHAGGTEGQRYLSCFAVAIVNKIIEGRCNRP